MVGTCVVMNCWMVSTDAFSNPVWNAGTGGVSAGPEIGSLGDRTSSQALDGAERGRVDWVRNESRTWLGTLLREPGEWEEWGGGCLSIGGGMGSGVENLPRWGCWRCRRVECGPFWNEVLLPIGGRALLVCRMYVCMYVCM